MKNKIKSIGTALLTLGIIFTLSACNTEDQKDDNQSYDNNSVTENTVTDSQDELLDTESSNQLVVYFSLAGEQYNVGVIEEGNTSIIAHMIAEELDADLFEIQPLSDYPKTHSELLDVSRAEMDSGERPAIADTIDNFNDYDVLFIGYPIWWADMPMIVYNFLESYDFDGKVIVPFCTHGGSGLAQTESTIAELCPNAVLMDGLAIAGTTAQNDREAARLNVIECLKEGDFIE